MISSLHITGFPAIHKTRFTELGYWHLSGASSFWQCVDLTGDKPAQIGTQYATEKELLTNLEAYATEYGCDGANPKSPSAADLIAALEECITSENANCFGRAELMHRRLNAISDLARTVTEKAKGANPEPALSYMDTVEKLRDAGYAVVVFNPEELAGVSRNRVEDRLCELGWEVIGDLKPESDDDEDEEDDEAMTYEEVANHLLNVADNLRRADIGGAHDPRNDRED
jgi:hypothetical protein